MEFSRQRLENLKILLALFFLLYNPQNEMLMDAKTKCVMTQNEKQKRNVTDCI